MGLYYPRSENKGVDQLHSTAQMVTVQLICVFVFAYAKSWFSHNEVIYEKDLFGNDALYEIYNVYQKN